jgi:hypothetical protein
MDFLVMKYNSQLPKFDFRHLRWGGMHCIHLAQDRNQDTCEHDDEPLTN